MRHRMAEKKLGRTGEHRSAMVAALVCGLITRKRITTTVTKAKVTRQAAERLVTVARKGTLAARRQAGAALGQPACVRELFDTIVPRMDGRNGGYTRVVKLGTRTGDGAEMAILEWVEPAAGAAEAGDDSVTKK
jgi:large subunit ribosomal protein L17